MIITLPPDPDATLEERPLTRAAVFGDGYEQITPKGLTSPPLRWSVAYSNLTKLQMLNLLSTLKAAKGALAVEWKSPNDDDERDYLVIDWRVTALAGKIYRVTVNLEEKHPSYPDPLPQ